MSMWRRGAEAISGCSKAKRLPPCIHHFAARVEERLHLLKAAYILTHGPRMESIPRPLSEIRVRRRRVATRARV